MYSPIYSARSGWILGRIENHVATNLTKDELELISEILNDLSFNGAVKITGRVKGHVEEFKGIAGSER